jgi:diaminohydroxyphosphoribosylaminopyrimidine deaminase / 5-amino-6-(5-phosphoribosylamino)uracil reductase
VSVTDETFMREALRLAKRGLGRTSPNPAVGAVIVRKGRVIAGGYHRKAGSPHAEIEALGRLQGKARPGDTLYVTLEPCNHHGRTPPCTLAILERGIAKVVVGMGDPNPTVSGGGCAFLASKGVEIREGVLEAECRRLNEAYIKFVTTGRPFVIAKTALTLDGWTATSTGHSKWVTGEASRRFVHRLRNQVDAVMVGVETILADDPLLDTRLKGRKGKNPIRIVLDTRLRTPHRAKILSHSDSSMTWIAVGDDVRPRKLESYASEAVSFLPCPKKRGRIDLGALMHRLGEKCITSVLLEGGSTVMGSMIRERLVDKFYVFKAPRLLGGDDGIPMARGAGVKGMEESIGLRDLEIRRFGEDVLFAGYPCYAAHKGGTDKHGFVRERGKHGQPSVDRGTFGIKNQ